MDVWLHREAGSASPTQPAIHRQPRRRRVRIERAGDGVEFCFQFLTVGWMRAVAASRVSLE